MGADAIEIWMTPDRGSVSSARERWLDRAAGLAGLDRADFTHRAELAFANQIYEFFGRTVLTPAAAKQVLELVGGARRGAEARAALGSAATMDQGEPEVVISPISDCDVAPEGFRCGAAEVDGFLENVLADRGENPVLKLFVAMSVGEMVGFYAITPHVLDIAAAREGGGSGSPESGKLSGHYLAAVGVRVARQGEGIGRLLLSDAIARTSGEAGTSTVALLLADARNSRISRFYARMGGVMLVPEVNRMLFVTARASR